MSVRFGLYPEDSRTVWERRHICIILVDSQPEAGRFICNRISLKGVLFDNVVLSLLENNKFNTCIMLMVIFEN